MVMDYYRLHWLNLLYVSSCYFFHVFGNLNLAFTTISGIQEDVVLMCPMDEDVSISTRTWTRERTLLFAGKFPFNSESIQMRTDSNYSLIITNVSLSNEGNYTCSDNKSKIEVQHLLLVYASRARNRQGNQDITSGVSLDMLDSGVSKADQSIKEKFVQKDGRKELPRIPVDEEDSQNSGGSEPNYYSTADAITGKDPRIITEKDISIIMNIKMGKIYKRWMASINLGNETNKCVVVTTLTERVMEKKEIYWETFLKKCLELPTSNYLAKIEAISIQSSKLFLMSEHFVCEDLFSVLSRDTKEKGDYYCCSSLPLPDVIKHIAGVLEGMDILKTFGFLHPGLTTKKILLTKGGLVKLYDFCLAGDASKIASLKKAQIHRVTLNEFPPEMLLMGEYTESSDVWSTAVAIWEIMAAGNPPFPKDQEVKFDKDATSPSTSWPDKYLQIKDKVLYECWNHNATLRPSIHHLRGTFVAIFEKLITDSSYEIPMPTMYLPMRAPDTTQISYAPMGTPDTTQTTYSERIYHVGE